MSRRVRQCSYIYQHPYRDRIKGNRCTNEATNRARTSCDIHREALRTTANVDPTFPRLYTDEEERAWVTEARIQTDPERNVQGVCLICGQFKERSKLVAIAERELIRAQALLSRLPLYVDVPEEFFQYGPGYHRLSGLVLDPRGFFKAEELATGSDFLGSGCVECWQEISKGVMPIGALANGLWTGTGQIRELADLTWIEEKLIARTHVSIQLQKCRLRRNLSWDHFYSQSRIKGHIVTFPMDPTTVLQRLPLPLARLSELIKVVFVSRREISHTEASALSFFLVRRNKVLRALQWLVCNNPLYAGVEIDDHAINNLPLDGLPREVYETITFSNRMTEDIASHSRYDEADDSGSFIFEP
jgi:hypothetical protein